jgi:hypothetical protein
MASGELKIELSQLPNKEWGSVPKNIPEIFRLNNYTFWQYLKKITFILLLITQN